VEELYFVAFTFGLVKINQSFSRIFYLHIQYMKVSYTRNSIEKIGFVCGLFYHGFFQALFVICFMLFSLWRILYYSTFKVEAIYFTEMLAEFHQNA
jgi:hypothetical protein